MGGPATTRASPVRGAWPARCRAGRGLLRSLPGLPGVPRQLPLLAVLKDEDVLTDPVALLGSRRPNLEASSGEYRCFPAADTNAPGGGHGHGSAGGVRLPPGGSACRTFHDLAPVVGEMSHGRTSVRESGVASPAVTRSRRQEADTAVHHLAHLLEEPYRAPPHGVDSRENHRASRGPA